MKKKSCILVFALLILSLVCIAFTACQNGRSDDPSAGGAKVELKAEPNDPSMGTVIGGGIYWRGAKVTVTATPNEGYIFTGWSDGNSYEERVIVAYEDEEYVAIFEPIPAPTEIIGVYFNNSYIWGEKNCPSPDGDATVHYDNGTRESVKVSELEISGISTDEVGYFKATINYKGFERTEMYSVNYAHMDASALKVDGFYTIGEELSFSGYITVYGAEGYSKRIMKGNSELEIKGFDSSNITYDAEKRIIVTNTVKFTVPRCPGSAEYSYSVWYDEVGAIYSGDIETGEYKAEVSGFTFDPDGSFKIKLTLMKKIDTGWLTEDVYEEDSGIRYIWKHNESDPEKIELYTKKNYLSDEVKIGFYNSKSGFLTLDKNLFDGIFINIEFEIDPQIGLFKDENE